VRGRFSRNGDRSKPGLAGSQRHALADEIRLFDIVNIHPAGQSPSKRERHVSRERSEPLSLADLGKKIKSDHEALANSIASIVPRAISIGEDLNKANALVGHGSFLKWVKLNCAMSNKNAERYMKLATGKDKLLRKLQECRDQATDKFDMLSNLSLAQAQRLIDDQRGGGDGKASDAYDNAEKLLMKKLDGLSGEVVEAAARLTATLRCLWDLLHHLDRVLQSPNRLEGGFWATGSPFSCVSIWNGRIGLLRSAICGRIRVLEKTGRWEKMGSVPREERSDER
jgi:hypothetical protein